MTSKRKQIKKIPIFIFFSKDEINKNYKKIIFDEFSSYSVFKSDKKVLIDLSKISNLNTLQKNYELLLIGLAIKNYCKTGSFFVEYFGCKKTDVKNFFIGWSLADYSFEKYKSKKKSKSNAKIFHEFEKEIKYICESYFFTRDLINTPANIMGPNEIFYSAKKFLKKYTVLNLVSGRKLESKFPLISAVGQGADDNKKPIFCEFKLKKINLKKRFF